MNDILLLKGKFESKKGNPPKAPNLPKGKYVNVEHLINLKNDLTNVQKFWKEEPLKIKPLVSAYYIDVVAKSNRIKGIFGNGSQKNNESIVGAKFTKGNLKKHIITHCIEDKVLTEAISTIEKAIQIVSDNFGKFITHTHIEEINNKNFEYLFDDYSKNKISRTRFVNVIVDAYYLEKFDVEREASELEENAIITLYDTGTKTSEIMRQLGINFLDVRSIDETTILLSPDQYKILMLKAPYLISMAVNDISLLDKIDFKKTKDANFSIPEPKNEPIVGVIDTLFDENVYFSKWVEFKNMLGKDIYIDPEDKIHGTMVSSIIVDGASINPNLNDGCGRFRVRHFGVAKNGRFSSFTVLRAIKEIVEINKDIKVWNLSLGSSMEINPNFISPEAYILDEIQYQNDVIFVVAGTNKTNNSKIKKIGAPADSINSLVVNSVDFNGKPADYSREGLVLSFYNKPDVSYYGGVRGKHIRVCSPLGEALVSGTSFAAPWIARKLAYLIEVAGLSREVAKALIIDSATGWRNKIYSSELIGYGVVPINIEDIIKTPKDEIKFMITESVKEQETYNYNIPVPIDGDKQPFVSKATLCYFPNCSRNQGVDYTNTEMDIHFGRINKTKTGKIHIKTINDNKQSEDEKLSLYEGTARKMYRKWDNVKHIRENVNTPSGKRKRPKIIQSNGLWGISIKTKERLNSRDGQNLKFGLVITLKEINGKNRIDEFIQQCYFRGWLVNKINVDNMLDVYNKANEELDFD